MQTCHKPALAHLFLVDEMDKYFGFKNKDSSRMETSEKMYLSLPQLSQYNTDISNTFIVSIFSFKSYYCMYRMMRRSSSFIHTALQSQYIQNDG